MNWIGSKMPDLPVRNFTSDWRDGKAIGALVDGVAPGRSGSTACAGSAYGRRSSNLGSKGLISLVSHCSMSIGCTPDASTWAWCNATHFCRYT